MGAVANGAKVAEGEGAGAVGGVTVVNAIKVGVLAFDPPIALTHPSPTSNNTTTAATPISAS
ncbi:MAG: hypothetical protein HZB52_00855 [Chloroflexi bacterium]|nr:hypothetical protein [Chloroflexota bacterium]